MRGRRKFMLRIRHLDTEPWGPPEAYDTRKERDECAAFNRILGGIRTHSYEEYERPDSEWSDSARGEVGS